MKTDFKSSPMYQALIRLGANSIYMDFAELGFFKMIAIINICTELDNTITHNDMKYMLSLNVYTIEMYNKVQNVLEKLKYE